MLTPEMLAFYRENGYVLVPGLLTADEAADYRKQCHELAERLARIKSIEATWGSARKNVMGAMQTSLLHCHDVQFQAAAFTRLLTHPRFVQAASAIVGPNVQLHHTKMFIKPPEKGSPFPLHQDYPFFPHVNHSMIAATIHFDDAPLEKGCLRFIPGSHKRGPLPQINEGGWHLPPDQYPLESATPIPAKAGDAVFFSYLTIHGSGLNLSREARTTLLVQMRDPADPPLIRTHESRGQGMMLCGTDPSCATTTPLNESGDPYELTGGMM